MGNGNGTTVKKMPSRNHGEDKKEFWGKLADKVRDFFSDRDLDGVGKDV